MVAGGGGGVDCCLGFEETELRLGLPGGGGNGEATAKGAGSCKRGFSETIDLKLKLTTAAAAVDPAEDGGSGCGDPPGEKLKEIVASEAAAGPKKPPAPKAQVVGWPPVRSFCRKNVLSVKPAASKEDSREKPAAAAAAFVKVIMDGAPYLRKVDLRMHSSYRELSMALEKMFGSFTTGTGGGCPPDENKVMTSSDLLLEGSSTSKYVATYEDKDGDWMLVGDVPWEY